MSSARDDRVADRFECVVCGSVSTVNVHPSDRGGTITYACSGDCGGCTKHRPADFAALGGGRE